ncbi:type 2 DNA topoisomerase 6 subunit B-like [Sorex fumeus]|uniref:type 2 DNA topoisomerase 6 subunit B-like n=1 Tax=Sorex fumeus TaxID=62283 RepID=UPI0024AE1178|nr:type 2 DNA topoisomerase 6 subunit B-like [Sorex fumeus]
MNGILPLSSLGQAYLEHTSPWPGRGGRGVRRRGRGGRGWGRGGRPGGKRSPEAAGARAGGRRSPEGREVTGRRRCPPRAMEGTAMAVCQILKYLIIHWKYETARVSKGALLERQLVISIKALNSKHQTNTLHCVTTIASAGNIYGGLILKKLLKEMLYTFQSILPGFSAKLNWTSEEVDHSQNTSGPECFQMIFEVDENLTTLVTGRLVIKNFLHKIIMVHPKIRFNFNINLNGIFYKEIFEAENEPTLNLSDGMALVVSSQHYVSIPKFGTTKLLCSRIHPVLGHPVMLFIPDDVAEKRFLEELILTPAAALCPCPKAFSNQLSGISSVSIFLYGPSGLPLILPSQEQTATTVFRDASYFIDWKKYHLCMVPNLDCNLDRDLVLPDVSYQVESSESGQTQHMDPQGQTLLLFLFVDFHSGFSVEQKELWGVHTWLTTHLSRILMESRGAVQNSLQLTVDCTLEQHRLATKAHQTLQTSLSVAVNSILRIVTESTSSSFRNICLQTLQATDTQEFGTKLDKAFHEIILHHFLPHSSCEVKQITEKILSTSFSFLWLLSFQLPPSLCHGPLLMQLSPMPSCNIW